MSIINQHIKKYSAYLNHDDVVSHTWEAVYDAFNKYEENHKNGAKFTSFLFMKIKNKLAKLIYEEKHKYLKNKNKIHSKYNITGNDISNIYNRQVQLWVQDQKVKDILDSMNDNDRNMILDKFWGKMTNDQIAKKYNFNSGETIRLRIKKILADVAAL